MIPILFEAGPFHLYTYGLTIALGVALALVLMQRTAVRDGFTNEQVYDFVFISVLAGFSGARLFYAAQHFSEFRGNPLEIFALWRGGLIFYGGLAAGFFMLWVYTRKHKLAFFSIMDFILPYGALVHAFGRLGCFLNGCCFGRACDRPWAVTFPGLDQPVHPTQLYEAFYNIAVFFILRALYRRRPKQGLVTASYLLLYGMGRLGIEFFRAGNPGWLLTWNQWISAALIFCGLAFGIGLLRKPARIRGKL